MLPNLILASRSPRRRELLRLLGVRFEVRPAELDETQHPGEDPSHYVKRLAIAKAQEVVEPGELVLAADTIVVVDEQTLGKPRDSTEAARMLQLLSARKHQVLSGVALVNSSTQQTAAAIASTEVTFGHIGQAEIDWYISTREPLDKAGAYAIQGLGSLYIEELRGTHSNVVGLPIHTTARLFEQLGYRLQQFRSEDRTADQTAG